MKKTLMIVIPIMIITSYIILIRWNVNYEKFENIQVNSLKTTNVQKDSSSAQTNTSKISNKELEKEINFNVPTHMYNEKKTLDDPISDAYLPYSNNVYTNKIKSVEQVNFEYSIITIFKNILDRNPTPSEITKYSNQLVEKEIDETMLKVHLMNSSEYMRNTKLQSNEVASDTEYASAKDDLLSHINKIYFKELGKEAPKMMLLPLKDIYVYLQNNEYLFRAMLINDKYKLFEKEVLNTKFLTKSSLSTLFEKYFILYELKLKANDIKKTDILNREKPSNVSPIPASNSGASLNNPIVKSNQNEVGSSVEKIQNSNLTELEKLIDNLKIN